MQLYFSPLACSLATRIALYEAGAQATFTEVDPKSKQTMDGHDFRAIHPLGLVPALRTDAGEVLTENAAVLQYVADQFPASGLAPAGGFERSRLQQWLNFIGTELHRGLFAPLLDPRLPEAMRGYLIAKGTARLDYLAQALQGREFLLDRFTVADAYLTTVLNWAVATPVDLSRWPVLAAYVGRQRQRPSVARALSEEWPLYRAEVARHQAADEAAAAAAATVA